MAFINRALTALKRIFIVIGIAVAFSIGLIGAIVLSLRSSETKVPDIVGKDRITAESTISSAGLNFRVRAMRPSSDAKPDTVIIQVPEAGRIVKVGQTVAVDISRPAKEGETSSESTTNANTANEGKSENTNANLAANSNDNKPKKKPKNANDNANLNANRSANRNRNSNVNRAGTENSNANRAEAPVHNLNSNSPGNRNTNRGNVNRRPPASAPTP